MVKTVFLDTGPLVALLNPRDQYHLWAQQKLLDIEGELVTCESVLSESIFLSNNFLHTVEAIKGMLEDGLLTLDESLNSNIDSVISYLAKYSDVNNSLADMRLICMYNNNKAGSKIFTTDSDFHIYRDSKGNPLNLISPYKN